MRTDIVDILYIEDDEFLKISDEIYIKFDDAGFIVNIKIIRNGEPPIEYGYEKSPVKFECKKSKNDICIVKKWPIKIKSGIKTIYSYNDSVYVFLLEYKE